MKNLEDTARNPNNVQNLKDSSYLPCVQLVHSRPTIFQHLDGLEWNKRYCLTIFLALSVSVLPLGVIQYVYIFIFWYFGTLWKASDIESNNISRVAGA